MATFGDEMKIPVQVFGLKCSLALICLFKALRVPECPFAVYLTKTPVFIRFNFPWGAKWVWWPKLKVGANYDH